MRQRPGWAGGLAVVPLALLGMLLSLPADAEAPETEAPAQITCRVEPTRGAIELACRTTELEEGSTLRMVTTGPGEDDPQRQGASPVTGGPTRAVVAVPCGTRGTVQVEASARAADGTRLVHRQPLEVTDGCAGRWDLTTGQWVRLLTLALLPVAALVALVVVRRRR